MRKLLSETKQKRQLFQHFGAKILFLKVEQTLNCDRTVSIFNLTTRRGLFCGNYVFKRNNVTLLAVPDKVQVPKMQ